MKNLILALALSLAHSSVSQASTYVCYNKQINGGSPVAKLEFSDSPANPTVKFSLPNGQTGLGSYLEHETPANTRLGWKWAYELHVSFSPFSGGDIKYVSGTLSGLGPLYGQLFVYSGEGRAPHPEVWTVVCASAGN